MAVSPATAHVTGQDGKVTLGGQVELKSQLSFVEEMTRHIDGVATTMAYRHDDTHEHLPPPMGVEITHETLALTAFVRKQQPDQPHHRPSSPSLDSGDRLSIRDTYTSCYDAHRFVRRMDDPRSRRS
jgi:hypothetical protein